MPSEANSYVVITPVRDEQANLPHTIESMLRQTVKPSEWVIVNDGSIDGTPSIIDEAAQSHSWIRAVHRKNRGFRKSGGGVVETVNDGLNKVSAKNWDFLVKLDADLSFEPDYFARCFSRFAEDSSLGIGGGFIYNLVDGRLVPEPCPRFHVRGATKIYRRSCWDALGGLLVAPGWDTLDEVKAQMKGWTTRTFEDIPLTQHKVTGAADGTWADLVKNGRANYICGYHPLFMSLKCFYRLFRAPYLLGSAALGYGFVSGYLHGIRQVDDPSLIRYLRQQQLRKIMGRGSIWR